MSEINPLNSTVQVIQTSQSSISQELDAPINQPQPKTVNNNLSSRKTTILTKENSPDKTKGVASNDGKSVEDLKTEHDSKKEAPGKLTIFEKIKLGWKKLPLFEKIAAGLLMAASAALAIMVSAPLAGILAIGTIVYIAKDVQNAYNTEKLKIEADHLENLNGNLQASSKNLGTNLEEAEEENKKLKDSLNSLRENFDKIKNEAKEAKENIGRLNDDLKTQQEQDKNIKTGLIDGILKVYKSISEAQQNQISNLESAKENSKQISTSNNEILSKNEEITSISNEITSEINNFCLSIFDTQKTDTNNQAIENNLSEKIDKEILSKKLGELSKEDLGSILNRAINLNISISGKTNKINKLSSEIQIECEKITENSNSIKKIVDNVINSLTETQKEYEKTLINVAKKVIIEMKNSDNKKWFFQTKSFESFKGKIQTSNDAAIETLMEKLNNEDTDTISLSSEEAKLILNTYKDKILTDKNEGWEKASENIENFINGFTKNGEIMQQLKNEELNIGNNIVSIGSSIENSMKIMANINKISGEITAVSKNLKDLIGPNASSLATVASLGIALGGLASMAVSAPVIAGIGGLLAIESATGIASKYISIAKDKIFGQ